MPQNLVSANAGTLESSDLFVRVLPNEGQGVSIELESSVYEIYSESIYEIANDVVKKMNLKDIKLIIQDKGALDYVIEARVQSAIFRALGQDKPNWSVL